MTRRMSTKELVNLRRSSNAIYLDLNPKYQQERKHRAKKVAKRYLDNIGVSLKKRIDDQKLKYLREHYADIQNQAKLSYV